MLLPDVSRSLLQVEAPDRHWRCQARDSDGVTGGIHDHDRDRASLDSGSIIGVVIGLAGVITDDDPPPGPTPD